MANADALRAKIRDRAERRHAIAVAAIIETVQEAAPQDSGILAATIGPTGQQTDEGHLATTIAAPVDYASYQDQGTGIYGPRGQRIVSQSGGPLVFEAGGVKVFAMSVAGSPATHFWSDNVTPDAWTQALEDAGAYL